MDRRTALRAIFEHFARTSDRYAAHASLAPLLQQLSRDQEFLHDAIRHALSEGHLRRANVLTMSLANDGEVSVDINIFAPDRSREDGVAADYIHHHGRRLLSSSVIHGGYDAIMFERQTHQHRVGDAVAIRMLEPYRHTDGGVRFVDSHTCHVVFRPQTLSATLAVWSADARRPITAVKRALSNSPEIRQFAAKAARALHLNDSLGLNPIDGVYFKPADGKIVCVEHDGEFDISREELVACTLHFLSTIGFNDSSALECAKEGLPASAAVMIDEFKAGASLVEIGVDGHPLRRFTRADVLKAVSS